MGADSRCGDSPASPKTSDDVATKTRMSGSRRRAAPSSVAVAPPIASRISAGSSHHVVATDRLADDAGDVVALGHQELGEVRAVLPGDAGDQRPARAHEVCQTLDS